MYVNTKAVLFADFINPSYLHSVTRAVETTDRGPIEERAPRN